MRLHNRFGGKGVPVPPPGLAVIACFCYPGYPSLPNKFSQFHVDFFEFAFGNVIYKKRGKRIILKIFILPSSVRGRLAKILSVLFILLMSGSKLILRYVEIGRCITIPR